MDFLYIIVVVILLSVILFYQIRSVKRNYKKEIKNTFKRSEPFKNQFIKEDDIGYLPSLLKKCLINSGVIGSEKVKNIKVSLEGLFNPGNEKWSQMKVNQYNFF